ncbi:phosphoribosylpyrophosphate synthetase [Sunxiuqinia indica]|uniref:phosphoribosylpyrophosphate synthetase n=1 Tax=Sunxiuqinia indica TaxID=2692584 RepID=UPI001357482C|nr:phosphoribosylpyrophosphate synthetase [Sunxiuqinia indica]
MSNNNQYDTLVGAIEALKKRGFTHNFSVNKSGQLEENSDKHYQASEVILHEFHRFEGNTNPADMSIVYAVETKSGAKGTVVDSYGVDGSEIVSEFMNSAEQKQFD